jgi:hypothetical protein
LKVKPFFRDLLGEEELCSSSAQRVSSRADKGGAVWDVQGVMLIRMLVESADPYLIKWHMLSFNLDQYQM